MGSPSRVRRLRAFRAWRAAAAVVVTGLVLLASPHAAAAADELGDGTYIEYVSAETTTATTFPDSGGTDLHLAPELLPTSREPDCVFAVTYNAEGNGAVESYAVYFPVDDALFAESVAVVEAAGFTYQSRNRPEYDPASGFWGGSTGPDLTGDYVLISNNEASQLAADWGIQLPADVSIAMVHYTALDDS